VTPRATPNANGAGGGVKDQKSSKKFGFTASQSAIKKPFHLVNRKSHALVSVG